MMVFPSAWQTPWRGYMYGLIFATTIFLLNIFG